MWVRMFNYKLIMLHLQVLGFFEVFIVTVSFSVEYCTIVWFSTNRLQEPRKVQSPPTPTSQSLAASLASFSQEKNIVLVKSN